MTSAHAACPSPDTMAGIARHWQAKTLANGLDKDMSLADAQCGQKLYLQELAKTQGAVVGYKAGLTNPAVQKRFGTEAPIRGTLFANMLVASGTELPAAYGSRPVFEADLIVEVKDEGINQAKTPADVMRHLGKIIPFIELPDLLLEPRETLNGATLTAINVGTRLGVLGNPLAPADDLLDALANMSVVVRDTADGNKELAKGSGASLLGHPLNAVIWLAQDLARDDGKLKAGDLLSLGSFTPLLPPKPGMAVQVSYEGLPGNPNVSVSFK